MATAIILKQKVERNGKCYYPAKVGWCFSSTAYVPESWMMNNKIDFKGKKSVAVHY
jgi:hypothetical protein